MSTKRDDWNTGRAPDESEPWDNIPDAVRDLDNEDDD